MLALLLPAVSARAAEEVVPLVRPEALAPFYGALAALEDGSRTEPVTILHLGDSHIARDGLSGPLRDLFQTRFGAAPRGMMVPGEAYAWFDADGFEVAQGPGWRAVSALPEDAKGVFGLAGTRVVTDKAGAWLAWLGIEAPGSAVAVGFWREPEGGSFTVSAGDASTSVATAGEGPGFATLDVPPGAQAFHIRAAGDGPVTLLSVSLEAPPSSGGVRLVNFGIPGATAVIMTRWNEAVIAAELARLAPDLIILGYGTNEGFDDRIDLAAYRELYGAQVARLKRLAPGAALLVIGGPDGARLPPYADPQDRPPDDWTCAPLTAAERQTYEDLIADEAPALLRWHDAPNLGPLLAVQDDVAAEAGIAAWDWRAATGGACGIHRWRLSAPALARGDHIHLTGAGNRVAAGRLFDALMTGFGAFGPAR